MSARSELKTLYHVLLKPVRGRDHAARMESFYAGQAESYDEFRRRMLEGRQELYESLDVPEGGVWVEMGGGTGSNLEYLGPRIGRLQRVFIVDLSASQLAVARRRIERQGWRNVETVEADATQFRPPKGTVPFSGRRDVAARGAPSEPENRDSPPPQGEADVVTFSYSLTMIPDWFAALENAAAMLKPGGRIGVVDFYVSRRHPAEGMRRHGWFARSFWPIWFALNNVFPSPDHVPYLHRRFEPLHFSEHRAKVPYLPLLRTPYYEFVGQKRS